MGHQVVLFIRRCLQLAKFVNNNIDGQIMSLFIIIVAAAEAAVGLGIVIRFFQIKESIHIDSATQLQS